MDMDTKGKGGINKDSHISGLVNCINGAQEQDKHNFEFTDEDIRHPNGNGKQAQLACQISIGINILVSSSQGS